MWWIVVVSLVSASCARSQRCLTEVRERTTSALATCEREWKRDGDAKVGASLAGLYIADDRVGEAAALAQSLLDSPAAGDAHRVLGQVALRQAHGDEAREQLRQALVLHGAAHDMAGSSRDHHTLASVELADGHYAEGFRALDDSEVETKNANDDGLVGSAHLLAAYTLRSIGFAAAAERELNAAEPLIGPTDRPWLWLELGQLHIDVEHWQLAVAELSRALAMSTSPVVTTAARLNLAYALAHTGQFDEAARLLALVADDAGPQRLYSSALVEIGRGRATTAAAMLERAFTQIDDDDWQAMIANERALVARGAGDLPTAERWARTAVAAIERLRQAQTAVEMRPWVLASRRDPYETLFTVLAGQDRALEAFELWDQVQGRSLWDLVIASSNSTPHQELGVRAESLRAAFPSLTMTPARAAPTGTEISSALRGRDVLVLAVAAGDVWRMFAHDGGVRMERVGPLAALAPSIARLVADPDDRDAAETVGAALAPLAWIAPSAQPLVIVADPALDDVPFPALARGAHRLIDDRVVLRSTSVASICGTGVPHGAGAVVLGDARGDLPGARREAAWVASHLGVTAQLGAAATREAARVPADVLHLAVHGEIGTLMLADGGLGADVIAQWPNAPRLVVVSACASASARDRDQLGAIANAFIAAGAAYVVATSRAIPDEEALRVTQRFYELGGRNRPAEALAQVQRELARVPGAKAWATYAVYWHDAHCNK